MCLSGRAFAQHATYSHHFLGCSKQKLWVMDGASTILRRIFASEPDQAGVIVAVQTSCPIEKFHKTYLQKQL